MNFHKYDDVHNLFKKIKIQKILLEIQQKVLSNCFYKYTAFALKNKLFSS